MTTEAITLREIPLDGGPVEFRGALDLETTPAGHLLPRRLPAWTRAQYPDQFMDLVAATPSGVRLAFRTAATVLELEVLTTARQSPGADAPEAGVLELLVDGEPAGRAAMPIGHVQHVTDFVTPPRLVPGKAGSVRFQGLPEGVKEVELWLPQQTVTELVALRADAAAEPPRPTVLRRWVHHGSSISHCAEADAPTGTWPVVAARLGGVEVVNLGFSGQALLDPYTARTIRDLPADLISLKLGINVVNRAAFRLRSFGPAVHGFLDTIREGHPDTPLLVVSPVICPMVEDTPGPTAPDPDVGSLSFVASGDPADVAEGALTLNVIRAELARVVARRADHDPNLHYLDGRELFGADDADGLPDHLHPDAAGYRLIGKRFAELAFAPGGVFAG